MNILLCDDHTLVREGLKQILQQLNEINTILEAGSASEALGILSTNRIDLLLLDISLPDQTGLELLNVVKAKWPDSKVLILSMHPQEQYALRALKYGASGYMTKDSAPEELLLAVKKVLDGDKYLSQDMAQMIALQSFTTPVKPKHESLSAREFDIMMKLSGGKSLSEIGRDLCISNKTVSTYRTRLMAKLGLDNNAQLTRYCLENQLI